MGNQLLCCDSANRSYHSESTIKKFDQPEFGNKSCHPVNNTLFYEADLYRQLKYRRRKRRRRRRTKTL